MINNMNYVYGPKKKDIIIPIVDLRESWTPITPVSVPNIIQGMYLISSLGRIYNLATNRLIYQTPSQNGYMRVSLKTINGYIDGYIHRIAMIEFCYRPDYFELEVNHKDGDKSNNKLYNLEWVTSSENKIHAYNLRLNSQVGETNKRTILTEAKVRLICECFCMGMSYSEVDYVLDINPEDKGKFHMAYDNILKRNTWVRVTCDYPNLPPFKNKYVFTIEECAYIYNRIKDSEEIDYINILQELGIDTGSKSEHELWNFERSINRIRDGSRREEIIKYLNQQQQ